MDVLPNEIVCLVFSQLCSLDLLCLVPKVCRRWRQLYVHVPVVAHIRIRHDVLCAVSTGFQLGKLQHLVGIRFLTDEPYVSAQTRAFVIAVLSIVPRLRVVELPYLGRSPKLYKLIQNGNLEDVTIRCWSARDKAALVNPRVLHKMAPTIRSFCPPTNSYLKQWIYMDWSRLVHLDLRGAQSLRHITLLIQWTPCLRSLDLSETAFPRVSKQKLVRVTALASLFERLDRFWCAATNIEDDDLSVIVQRLSKGAFLDVQRCSNLTVQSIELLHRRNQQRQLRAQYVVSHQRNQQHHDLRARYVV